MASADILAQLTAIANDWRWLAIGWHLLLATVVVSLLAGWRPSAKVFGRLLILPLVSVSVVAWLAGNPFNGVTLAVLAGALIAASTRLLPDAVRFSGPVALATGSGLVMAGSFYPHFLDTGWWTAFLYASPFGLLPCPTLLVVIGMTMMALNPCPRGWTTALVAAGLAYGAFGVFVLGVTLDWSLVAAAAALASTASHRSVRAARAERQRPLPGDALIVEPVGALTHAITIGGSRQIVWPWLVQMGAGSRAGWYSYDHIDNGHRPSATRIVPELQDIAIGTLFPALPGVTEGFKVLAVDTYRSLVLGWQDAGGKPVVTWAFVLEERSGNATRLIVRVRATEGYRFHGLPPWLSKHVVRFVHFVMQRKQLLGIARRVESAQQRDELLDRFIPSYDVVERHRVRVTAPAAVTSVAAREQDLFRLPVVRAIFRARELMLGSAKDDRPQPRGLVAATQALGWGVLADVRDRELVMGAVTKPWEPNVTFRALPPEQFAAFSEPGFVKIAWTLRADPVDDATSIFRTETRAVATDATARARFRRYWRLVSPGIVLIRLLSLRPLKREAERRSRNAA